MNGTACLSLISGSNGTNLIDNETNTCITIPQKKTGATKMYELSIYGNCSIGSEVTLNVAMESTGTCNDLRYVIVMAKLNAGCSDLNNHFKVCHVTDLCGTNVCSVKCKCTNSADQCLINLYSGLKATTPPVNICEIAIQLP